MEKEFNLSEEKKALRKRILKLRNEMSEAEREEKSEIIRQKLYRMPVYQNADTLLAYVDYQSEVITTPIIRQALAEGKKVYCPTVEGVEMEFYQIKALEDLAEGYKGIREPLPEPEKRFVPERQFPAEQGTTPGNHSLMLMPGAVFDMERHRIGYGKGFYDRYLHKMVEANVATIALAFACQIVEKVPAEEHDIRPMTILTEETV